MRINVANEMWESSVYVSKTPQILNLLFKTTSYPHGGDVSRHESITPQLPWLHKTLFTWMFGCPRTSLINSLWSQSRVCQPAVFVSTICSTPVSLLLHDCELQSVFTVNHCLVKDLIMQLLFHLWVLSFTPMGKTLCGIKYHIVETKMTMEHLENNKKIALINYLTTWFVFILLSDVKKRCLFVVMMLLS